MMSSMETNHEVNDIRHIFRAVAPLIIRQWKDVCRELDVQEVDIFEIERGKPWERLSEMAYQGLCTWLDREGRNATKTKLLKALRRCELKRAEEAVEGMSVRKPEKQSTGQRCRKMSPMKQRKSSSGSRTTDEKGHIMDQPKSLPRSAGRRYSHTSSEKRQKWQLESDEVAAEVTTTEIMADKPVSDSWMETYQKMVLHFYTSVVKNEDDHKRALTTLMGFKDVFVKKIMFGSLVVVISCKSLKGLDMLQQTYLSGQLEEMFRNELVRKSTLDEVGVKGIFLEVFIDPSYFERCRETLLARKIERAALKSGKSSRSGRKRQESETDVNWPQTIEEMESEIISLTTRSTRFQDNWKDILQALKSGREDSKKMTSFRDVIDCNSRMKLVNNIEANAVNLFQDYIDIVNTIKQLTEDLNQKLKKHRKASQSAEGAMSDIELLLHPDFPFKEDTKCITATLTGAEKRTFTGVLAYIPLLLAGLSKVVSAIKTSIT